MICVKCGHELEEGTAFCPHCGQKITEGSSETETPLYMTDVKGLLKSGKLAVYQDRVEFIISSVQKTVFNYSALVSVKKGLDRISFITEDGRTESCAVNRKNIHEAFLYIEKASRPYIAERKNLLLAKGIKYSFVSSQGLIGGILNISDDRAEFKSKSGQSETVFFQDVRAVCVYMGMLELSLTDGTTKSFAVDKDIWEEVLAFVENAIKPYILKRTAGFDKSFGIDERIEINEERGVFHIIRQGGNVITDEYPIGNVIKCERKECSTPDSMLGGVLSGGMTILNSAAKAVSTQGTSKTEEKISHVDALLSFLTDQGIRTESVRFGDFLLGMSRTNPKYDRYIAEVSAFMDYLGSNCPECELIVPVLPEVKSESMEIPADDTSEEKEASAAVEPIGEKDQFGIIKYIEGVSGFISECTTPMTIAIQGSWSSGKNSILKMLSDNLAECYKKNLIWFSTWQFAQSDSGEQLPMLVGNRLISQLGGAGTSSTKDRAIKAAKGIINITSGFISQGSTDGQNLIGALFKDSSADSPAQLVKVFSELVSKRLDDENGKVIIFIDDLERLTPAKAVELLEAMRNFFDCEGCVFVITVDYDSIIRGTRERYGQIFDESKAKSFFDKIFQVSFRVPVSGYNIHNYVKEKLAHIEINSDDEVELEFYVELIRHSVGCEPKSMDRLFNSFLLLKKLSDGEMYADKNRRLILFALLCMQTQFHDVYDFIVRMKDKVTPDFLSGLCTGHSEALTGSRLSDDERAAFCDFARIFCDIINADRKEDISESECKAFKEVLEFSSITSK